MAGISGPAGFASAQIFHATRHSENIDFGWSLAGNALYSVGGLSEIVICDSREIFCPAQRMNGLDYESAERGRRLFNLFMLWFLLLIARARAGSRRFDDGVISSFFSYPDLSFSNIWVSR